MAAAVADRRAAPGAVAPAAPTRAGDRLRAAAGGASAAVLGAAPHVLHHAGPLAGAALLAGATGKLVFAAIGLLLAVPMLRRLRRRHGTWVVPGGALALMAAVFAVSTFVIGPALTAGDDSSSAPAKRAPAPAQTGGSGHDGHHP